MYYFLTLIGIILILIGTEDDKTKEITAITEEYMELDDFTGLIKRIESLESTFSSVDMDFKADEEVLEFEAITYENVANSISVANKPVTIFDALRQCEEEGYSLEKTCSILNMNKGEVLLLKNLYKNYQG